MISRAVLWRFSSGRNDFYDSVVMIESVPIAGDNEKCSLSPAIAYYRSNLTVVRILTRPATRKSALFVIRNLWNRIKRRVQGAGRSQIPQQPFGCEDFDETRNAEIGAFRHPRFRNRIKHRVQGAGRSQIPQQPLGCEDFDEARNAEIGAFRRFRLI